MPTDTVSSISASGDYASVVAWEADCPADITSAGDDIRWIGELYINTVENPTLSGITVDATNYLILSGGAYNTADNYKHKGKLFGATTTIYGTLTCSLAYTELADFLIVGNLNVLATTCTFNRLITGPGSVPFFLGTGSVGSIVNSCISVGNYNAGGSGSNFTSRATPGTNYFNNCLAARSGHFNGYYQENGTLQHLNNAGFGNASATFISSNGSNCGSDDTSATVQGIGTGSLTFNIATQRRSTLLAYGTFDAEPLGASGKIARSALMRKRGDILGFLSTATISGGFLIGASGNCTYLTDTLPVATLGVAVDITLPSTGVSHTAIASKASGDNLNRITLGFSATGGDPAIILDVYDSAGTLDTRLTYDATALAGLRRSISGWYDGSALYIGVDGVQVATTVKAITRDATDSHTVLLQPLSGSSITIASWGVFTGLAVPPSIPLPLYSDGLGCLDDFNLTFKSAATLKTGGLVVGSPATDCASRPMGSKVPIGPLVGRRHPIQPIISTF